MNDINSTYFDIQNKFSKGEISFNEYSVLSLNWQKDFNNLIKAQSSYVQNDPSRGGKLVKKEGIDKNGKKITKWVRRDEDISDENGQIVTSQIVQTEKDFSIDDFKLAANTASEKSLKNASDFAASEEIRRIARNELFKRSFQPEKYLDLSLMPDFMIEDYVNRYTNENITNTENEAISKYRDLGYENINTKLRNDPKELDSAEKEVVKNISNAIEKSELKNDIILHRGISGNKATVFVNFLKSLKIGDIYEEKSFSSTSLVQGQAIKFRDLYKSQNNVVIKIYASKGQNALSMQNLGNEDDKIMYNDEFEFLLAPKSKFQVIETNGNEISVKLL